MVQFRSGLDGNSEACGPLKLLAGDVESARGKERNYPWPNQSLITAWQRSDSDFGTEEAADEDWNVVPEGWK